VPKASVVTFLVEPSGRVALAVNCVDDPAVLIDVCAAVTVIDTGGGVVGPVTAVRLKVEENQLVGIVGKIGVLVDGLKGL
jgi:hypothetical protein